MASKKKWKKRALTASGLLSYEQETNIELTKQMEYHREQHGVKSRALYEVTSKPTAEAKVDLEAAFQRGVEHAQGAAGGLGLSRYAMNRDGIMVIGVADTELTGAIQAVKNAQIALAGAIESLSNDTPPTPPAEMGYPINPFDCPLDDGVGECRCDETTGMCRIHDVGH